MTRRLPFLGLGNPGIARRLALGFSLLLLIMTAVVGVAAWQAMGIERQLDNVVNAQVPRMIKVQGLVRLVSDLGLAARDAIAAADDTRRSAALAHIEAGRMQVGQQIEDIQQALRSGGTRGEEAAVGLGNQSSGILIALVKFGRVVRSNNMEMARGVLSGTVQPRIEALGLAADQAQALQLQMLEEGRTQSRAAWHRALLAIAAALGSAVVLAALLAWRISVGITRPIDAAVGLAERIAAGDLCDAMQTTRDDELGRLQKALAAMQADLGRMVGDIREVADQMALASDEVSTGGADLSRRTEHAASTLQSTAASMSQLTERVRHNAASAHNANALASSTAAAAQRGGAVVSQVVVNMNDISSASRRIGDITTVIDGISFQTNLLALNAAVEAARAGEHGRGFAVVASEVRSLAQRAALAAREIKSLIAGSIEKIDAGCRLVQTAGGTMDDIVAGAHQVTGIIACISAASDEQSGALGRVNATVVQLDEMTQQNSVLVRQSAAAAHNMREQSQRLAGIVNGFRTAPR